MDVGTTAEMDEVTNAEMDEGVVVVLRRCRQIAGLGFVEKGTGKETE